MRQTFHEHNTYIMLSNVGMFHNLSHNDVLYRTEVSHLDYVYIHIFIYYKVNIIILEQV